MAGRAHGSDGTIGADPSTSSHRIPQELLYLLKPALQVGAFSGVSGLSVGIFAGILRSKTPVAFALASGISWGCMGTGFWVSRGATIHNWGGELSPKDKIKASSLGGGAAGLIGASLNGRVRIIPYSMLIAFLGGCGQAIFNRVQERQSEETQKEHRDVRKTSWWDSKWSFVRALPNQEYVSILRARLLSIDTRIETLDEAIQELKDQEGKLRQEEKDALDQAPAQSVTFGELGGLGK